MRIMLTGPRGFVGARIAQRFEVMPAPSMRDMDERDVRALVERMEPDVIVHTAAISDIAACERDPEASRRANVQIPIWLASAGVKCVMFSTDQVYSGSAGEGPYAEADAAPANTYAKHKIEMENRVLDINPECVLLRATWMYDMPVYGVPNRGNFLVNMLAARRGRIAVSMNQHRGVTYVRDVAERIGQALTAPGGVYNFGSENELTMGQTARRLSDRLDLGVHIEDAGDRHNLWMDCARARAAGIVFPGTLQGLEKCIADYDLK